MNKYINCINYLVSKNTQKISYADKTLFHHLKNVYDKLRHWGLSDDVCYAGMFYCFYKKNIETERKTLIKLIGNKAEFLVHSYNQKTDNKNIRIISLASLMDKKFLYVYDGLFDKKNILDFYFYFRDEISWEFTGSGVDKDKWRKFNYGLKCKHKIEKKLKKQTETILKQLKIFDLLKPERIYASANPYGTVHESHVDYPLDSKGGITVMYYLNNHWDLKFAGETVFYDNQEIMKSIIPKPARAIVFDGFIEHCARDVRRDFNDLRMVVTFKYNLNI